MNRPFPSLAFLLLITLIVLPSRARAQEADSTGPADTVFLQARRLVAEGKADSGRALVQRELDAAPAGSAQYAEALYWHAVVAATAADAERDLRRLVVEYPLSPRSSDALMRLAQLEMARGDADQAMAHLERVVVEHPGDPARPRAEFWMARMLFDRNDAPRACARLADASRSTPTSQVELRNQIDYLDQRCVGVDTTAAAAPAARGAASGSTGVTGRKISVNEAGKKSGIPSPATSRATGAQPATQYTIQVVAYSTRQAAEKMRASLLARGYEARVYGSQRPYRVRIGRYDSRQAADSVAAEMRAKHMSAYVTEAERP